MAAALDSTPMRLLGLATGVVFGALLHKGRVNRRKVIRGQLLFRDARVVKTIASAITVGATGFAALERAGLASKDIKPMKVGGVVGGAVLFGTGMAMLGYCPGTAIAASGAGRPDAMIGVLGMFAGAAAFVALYPKLVPWIDAGGDLGKATLPGVTATSSTPWIAGLAGATSVGAVALELAE